MPTRIVEVPYHAIFPTRRQIGPVGTGSRLLGGAAAIAVPVVLDGFGWWDAAAAFVLLPLVASLAALAISAVSRRAGASGLACGGICSRAGCLLVAVMLGADAALAALTSTNGTVALWVWLGGSMLLAAVAGYGGCEVLALPNLLTGRRDEIGCLLYTPIDRWEASRSAAPSRDGVGFGQSSG